MSRLTDAIEGIEFDLAKYPGSTAEDFRCRRLILRKALAAYGQEQYGEGHHDGMRDALDAQYRAREAAEAATEEGGGDDG